MAVKKFLMDIALSGYLYASKKITADTSANAETCFEAIKALPGATGDLYTGYANGGVKYRVDVNGNVIVGPSGSFAKTGGTSAQFLKADGSVDNNTYATAPYKEVQFTSGGLYLMNQLTGTVGLSLSTNSYTFTHDQFMNNRVVITADPITYTGNTILYCFYSPSLGISSANTRQGYFVSQSGATGNNSGSSVPAGGFLFTIRVYDVGA